MMKYERRKNMDLEKLYIKKKKQTLESQEKSKKMTLLVMLGELKEALLAMYW